MAGVHTRSLPPDGRASEAPCGPARVTPVLLGGMADADKEGLGYVGRQGEVPRMNRQYVYVIVAIVAVVVLAYVFGVFGGPKPASEPAANPPAAGTKTPS